MLCTLAFFSLTIYPSILWLTSNRVKIRNEKSHRAQKVKCKFVNKPHRIYQKTESKLCDTKHIFSLGFSCQRWWYFEARNKIIGSHYILRIFCISIWHDMFSKLSIFNIQNQNSNCAWHWPTFCGVQSFCSSTMFGIVVDEHVVRHSQKISLHTRGKWCNHLKNQILNFGALFYFFLAGKQISWNR